LWKNLVPKISSQTKHRSLPIQKLARLQTKTNRQVGTIHTDQSRNQKKRKINQRPATISLVGNTDTSKHPHKQQPQPTTTMVVDFGRHAKHQNCTSQTNNANTTTTPHIDRILQTHTLGVNIQNITIAPSGEEYANMKARSIKHVCTCLAAKTTFELQTNSKLVPNTTNNFASFVRREHSLKNLTAPP
jgi:hypothetical protein